MNRRSLVALVCVHVCVGSSMAGCESIRHGVRKENRDPDVAHASAEESESETGKILDVQSDAKKAKPFFRPSRLSGGLSSEAREIEDSLGIR